MKVVVRVRPKNESESDQRCIVKVVDDQSLIFDPKEEIDDFYYHGIKQTSRDLLRKVCKELRFDFDNVFDGDSSNEDIHSVTTMPILEGLLDGYNCSVFAYGATGAGKTFTMLGNPENPGITFLTVMGLFQRIEAMQTEVTIDLAVSYLEVYNENVKDLLEPNGILQVREDQRRGVIVPGLTLHKPKGAEELIEMLHLGNRRRTQHPTDANAESSRSHAVFTVYVKQQDRSNGSRFGLSAVRVSKLALIDLAGSERASMVSRGNGCRLREGANINRSLLALGNCINALADKKSHVPFRNSKLTRLLKDSLDGKCRTVMIATISPVAFNYEDTYNTLKYAARAKIIKTCLKQNALDVIVPVGQHMKVIQELRNENAYLKQQLQERTAPVIAVPVAAQKTSSSELEAIKDVLSGLFAERKSLIRQFLRVSSRVREMELRVQYRQKCMKRLALVSISNDRMDQSASKTDTAVARMACRKERESLQKKTLRQRLMENGAELDKAHALATKSNSEKLCEWLKTQHTILDSKVSQFREHHACNVASIQEQENIRSDRLLSESLRVVQRQYLILTANGLATSDIVEDFDGILKLVEGVKEVAWADQTNEEETAVKHSNIDAILNLSVAALEMPDGVKTTQVTSDRTSSISVHAKPCLLMDIDSKPQLCNLPYQKLANDDLTAPASTAIRNDTALLLPSSKDAAGNAILDLTFSKDEFDAASEAGTAGFVDDIKGAVDSVAVSSSRRLTFDEPNPLVPTDAVASCLASTSTLGERKTDNVLPKSSAQRFVVPQLVRKSKRPLGDAQHNDGAKKLKPSVSLSNLSTVKSPRKFAFQSVFDKPNRMGEDPGKVKRTALNKLDKAHPPKRNVLEPIDINGSNNGNVVSNGLQSIFSKRTMKPNIEPRTNALSRMRSKSTTNLKMQ